MRARLHPEATVELRAAAIWYDERHTGLGDEFVAAVASTLDELSTLPESFPVWPKSPVRRAPIRRATLRRFPYALAFEASRDDVLVLAVAHMKRRPFYWLGRLH